MRKWNYDKVQNELTALIHDEKLRSKGLNAKEREIYKKAVLACKSVLSTYTREETSE